MFIVIACLIVQLVNALYLKQIYNLYPKLCHMQLAVQSMVACDMHCTKNCTINNK